MKQIRRVTYSLNLHVFILMLLSSSVPHFLKKMKAHQILKASLTEKAVEVLILQK